MGENLLLNNNPVPTDINRQGKVDAASLKNKNSFVKLLLFYCFSKATAFYQYKS